MILTFKIEKELNGPKPRNSFSILFYDLYNQNEINNLKKSLCNIHIEYRLLTQMVKNTFRSC
jgi:hypothetical protein